MRESKMADSAVVGGAADGSATDSNATDGNATDGNATDGSAAADSIKTVSPAPEKAAPIIKSSLPPDRIKIKICGLSRPCDIDYVNEAGPDYCGFIIDVPKSRRNVTAAQVRDLRSRLLPSITPVGVFVNAPAAAVAALLADGTISIAQLHGQEDENYLSNLRQLTKAPIIQAFSIKSTADVQRAQASSADYILLDNGAGGTGAAFDWNLLRPVRRPYFLAGGLTPDNLDRAVQAAAHTPLFCTDLSSGVETDGYKDREKIIAAAAAVRRCNL